MATSEVSLKLLIDTKGKRVLFAEAGKDFVDFIFSILTLPISTIVSLISKEGMVGCLGNLYGSIEDLNESYMLEGQKKDTVLKPIVSLAETAVAPLLPSIESASTTKVFYVCSNCPRSYDRGYYVSIKPGVKCPGCTSVMMHKPTYVEAPTVNQDAQTSEGGFVKGVVTYMVMDDLVLKPMSTISSITMLNQFNIKDTGSLEEKMVKLTIDEGIKLLKASLQSKTVLTDVFLVNKY